jgi:hypothetical protein
MPTNPFGGIGSRGDERNIAEQTRALRAMEQARKRLISTMKGEERAVSGLAAAHSAAMQARSRDANAYERELTRTSGLLSAQGATLKNLDATRERYHREEMERSQSLLQRYEGIKQALREIQEDSDDTRTILGSLVVPFKAGIDNMLKFGNLPKVTQPIRDTAIDFNDVTGSIERSADAAQDLGRAMVDVAPTLWKYRTSVVELDAELKGLKVKYADATDETEKLAKQFVTLSKTDMIAPGAVKQITAVTDSLKFLEAQGVSTETAMGLLVERSRKSGRTFEASARDVEQVTAQADILRESLSETDTVLQGFAFTVRDDFVRAIADATRNLDSQVVSIENVSSAYAFAAKRAAEYGLSAEGAEKVSKAFAGMFFKEREDAAAFLSGRELQNQLSKALKDSEDALGVTYAKATEAQKKILEDMSYEAIGVTATDENRAALKQGISTLGEGLGEVDLRNLLAGTTTAIKADLDAQLNKIGISKITDTSVASRLLASLNGFEDLTTLQKRTLTDILMKEGTGSAAEEMLRLQEEAQKKAEDMKDMTSSALTAVLTFKDPIQQLFNIKDFLKSIMLNVSNIVKLVSQIPGLGGVGELYEDTTGESLQKDYAAAAVEAGLKAAGDERSKLLKDFADAQQELIGADTDSEKARRKADLETIASAIEENSRKGAELEQIREEYARITGGEGGIASREEGENSERGAGILSTLGSYTSSIGETLSETFGGLFGSGEEGRVAGVSMAQRTASTSTRTRPDARTAYERAQTGGTRAEAGEMEAAGSGEVTVDASGESVMTVRMRIKNMGEVIAHHSSTEARVYDQFGLGG